MIARLIRLIFGPPAAPPRPTPPTSPPTGGPPASIEWDVMALVAEERHRRGLPRLRASDALCLASADHADWMASRNGAFSHYGPRGQTWQDRAEDRGYPGPVSEVIAMGQRTPAEAVSSWLGSPGHRGILLHPSGAAIGAARSGDRWVALVGLG